MPFWDVVGTRQEQITRAFEVRASEGIGFALESPAQVINLLVDKLDDMKVIEDHCDSGQMLQDCSPVSRSHVAGHGLDFGAALAQTPDELEATTPWLGLPGLSTLSRMKLHRFGNRVLRKKSFRSWSS